MTTGTVFPDCDLWTMPMEQLRELVTEIGFEPEAATEAERQSQKDRHTAIRLAFFERQQAPPPPPAPTANQHVQMQMARGALPERLATRLNKLRNDREMSVLDITIPAAEGDALKLSPAARLLREDLIRKLILRSASALREYEITYFEVNDILNPVDALERKNTELRRCRDIDRIRELRNEIAIAASADANIRYHADQQGARAIASEAWQAVETELVGLLVASEHLLASYTAEARKSEAQFFEGFGLVASETAVSQRYQDALEKFTQKRQALQKRARLDIPPSPSSTALQELFGVHLN